MHIVFGIFLLLLPVSLLVTTVAALNCRGQRTTLIVSLVCWGLGLAILMGDPGQLMWWYRD